MTETGDDDPLRDDVERKAATGDVRTNAWIQTLEDMDAMATERRENGWETVTIPAGNTATVGVDDGDDDRFGIVHVIPDNYADEFTEAVERGEFPRYEAYRSDVQGYVYLVTELLDPDSATSIMIACQYELRHAPAMVASAREEGVLYTHVQTLDGTVLGSFRHEEFDPLVPDADRLERWAEGGVSPGRRGE